MPKTLTDAQIAQFETDGYVFPLDCLAPDEAAEIRAKFEAHEREHGTGSYQNIRIKSHLAFPWLLDLTRHPKILDAVEDLIGPDILIYLCTLWFKDANDPRFVSWHQDSAYYGLDPHDVVTMWIGLTESTREKGCVRVMPGTHRGPDQSHIETYDPKNFLSRGQTIEAMDDSVAVDMELDAGQFSLHHERLVHGSAANSTDQRRMGLSVVYMPPYTRCVVGRRTALLVRGTDRDGHWDADPEPRFDLDPLCLDHIRQCTEAYTDKAVRSEAERATGDG